ncbi:MAG TPA: hypothetical protein VFM58_18875, partial [Solirubrobacteraceae bacterium]|nr:hypothetical protein [Solirubrobacteraceae bacterium]
PPPGPAGESAERAAQPAAETGTAGAAAAPSPASPRRSEEVLDLGEASREAVLKRVAPVAAVLLGLIVILGLRRRGR